MDLSELNASLPPSNFGTRQGTRQASRVIDPKDVVRHAGQLFEGVDPQVRTPTARGDEGRARRCLQA